jgi:hypothetical protein
MEVFMALKRIRRMLRYPAFHLVGSMILFQFLLPISMQKKRIYAHKLNLNISYFVLDC